MLPCLRIQLFQPRHQLLSQKRTQPQHTLIRARAIRPSLLIPAVAIDKVPLTIHLQAPKNVLRPRDTPEIGRISLIADVNVPSSPRTAHAALTARAARTVSTRAAPATVRLRRRAAPLLLLREEDAARAQRGARLRGVHGRCGLHVGVLRGVFLDRVVQEFEEFGVLD